MLAAQFAVEVNRAKVPELGVFLLHGLVHLRFVDGANGINDCHAVEFHELIGHAAHLAWQQQIKIILINIPNHNLTSFASLNERYFSDSAV